MTNINDSPLQRALAKLYEIAGGSIDSNNVRASRLTTAQRIEYFRSAEFRDWVASEKAAGREVFWLKDVDKTQSAGDIFTFFFKWRADNNKFTGNQVKVIKGFLRKQHAQIVRRSGRAFPKGYPLIAQDVVHLWVRKETGAGDGIGLLDFWSGAYWTSQIGLTRDEKLAQVAEFIPFYAAKVYPGVAEENRVLTEAGVHVVIVSNGDQELAIAAAPTLGINPLNVVGSHLVYDESGLSTGVNHSYEVFGDDWHNRPQPGKHLSFHYWLHANRRRFGWEFISDEKTVLAGKDGDSASTDGGMMILMKPSAIGNFMIDTPGEPDRLEKFFSVAAKYGWTRGQFFTLVQDPSRSGRIPD